MSKVSDSYGSVTRGVSQQAPPDRIDGQMTAQDNMVSDPVRGLVRRRGSVYRAQKILRANNPSDSRTDTIGRTSFTDSDVYSYNDGQYDIDVIYRKSGYTGDALDSSSNLFPTIYNKTLGTFIPVVPGAFTPGNPLAGMLASGCTSVVALGNYVIFAINQWTPLVTSTVKDLKPPVWLVRGGSYSRTYSVSFQKPPSAVPSTYTYTTPGSAYPGVLDTSAITTSDPDRAKKVTDASNAYQTAVTQWLASSTAAIQPSAIAVQLNSLINTGAVANSFVDGAHIFGLTSGLIQATSTDGGDESQLRTLFSSTSSVDMLLPKYYDGGVIQITPKKADKSDSYYMQANLTGKDGSSAFGDYGNVRWTEGTRTSRQPVNVFAVGFYKAGQFYLANSPAELAALTPNTLQNYLPSTVGDESSVPTPKFLAGTSSIQHVTLFQDRLVIITGGTVFMSRPGDYFNFWPASVLTVADTDPIEAYAAGSTDDIIYSSVVYDKSLVLIGQRRWYTINGRQTVTPNNIAIIPSTMVRDAVDARPQSVGNNVMYTQYKNGCTSGHQVQPGVVDDNTQTFDITQQIDSYMQGKPKQIVATLAPNFTFIRTSGLTNGMYVYQYLDNGQNNRVFDSCHRWTWDASLGDIAGIAELGGTFTVYKVLSTANYGLIMVAEDFATDTTDNPAPYLDCMMPVSNPTAQPWFTAARRAVTSVVFGSTSPQFNLGWTYDQALTEYPAFATDTTMVLGVNIDCSVTLTNPYVKDKQGKAILNGRLSIAAIRCALLASGGLYYQIDAFGQIKWKAGYLRPYTTKEAVLGRAWITDCALLIPIGRETRDYKLTIRPIKWLPFRLTQIEWSGQFFYNQQRL